MKTFVDEYGVTYSEDKKVLIKGNDELEEYTVPAGTEVIGEDSWGKMMNLKSIVLPEGLVEIGRLAFSGCMGLTNLLIPSTVKEIGSYAFEFTMLRYAVIPEGITTLNNDVFDGCFALGTVVLPSTLERIEDHTFCSCPSTQILLTTHKRKLNYIADTAVDNDCIFLVPYELQKEYMDTFKNHSNRFFGLKVVADEGKADVYSPNGEVVAEIPVQKAE